jgi:hypothetical protein
MTSFLFPLTHLNFCRILRLAPFGVLHCSMEECMFLDQGHRLLSQVLDLKPRPRTALLQGKITLKEAQELSQLSRLKSKGVDALIESMHTRRHKGISERVQVGDDLKQMLVQELDRMPDHVAQKFVEGAITLLQARHATQEKHGRRKLKRTDRMNATVVIPKRFRIPVS